MQCVVLSYSGGLCVAHRDKSQGFGFIYTDIQTLLKQRDELKQWDEWEPAPENAQTVNFNRDAQTPSPRPQVETKEAVSIDQIREKLDRLSKLHQKLHVILEEINQLNPKKKD